MPYEASVFPPRAALVVAPHYDDEVFGCGGAIASLRGAGAEVRVLVLTDGAGDERDPEARARTAAIRRAESAAALLELGGAILLEASLPDRGLFDRLPEVSAAIAAAVSEAAETAIAAAAGPVILFAPSPAEVHPDHRAAAEAVLSLVRAGSRGLAPETLVAFYEISQPIRPNFLLDATPFLPGWEKAVASFPSQLAGHDYVAYIRGLRAYRRMTLPRQVAAAEAYFVLEAGKLRDVDPARLAAAVGPSLPPSELFAPAGSAGFPGFLRSLFRRPA